MSKYIIRRLLQALPLLFLIALFVFVLTKIVGDPLAYLANDPRVTQQEQFRLRATLGLNDPIHLQFVHWLIGDDWYQRDIDGDGEPDVYGQQRGILRGDFGTSIRLRQPVTNVIWDRLPNTLILTVSAFTITLIISVSIGIFSAVRQYSMADNIITSVSFILYSMPIYLVAFITIYIFAVRFRLEGLPYLPVQGMYSVRGDRDLLDLVWHMVLPVFCLSSISIAGYSRYVRASMLEVINSDYIRTARAKGLANRRVVFVHALKNASLPLITLVGLNIPFLLSGAVVTESIFAWPGMGSLFLNSLGALDAPVLVLFTLMIATAVVLFQLLTDIVYAWADPRVRFN
jgi:peptide/nickel transport system permease protein